MQFKDILETFECCKEAKEFAEGKTIEQAVAECNVPNYFLRFAAKIKIDSVIIVNTAGRCLQLISHKFKNAESVKAMDLYTNFEGHYFRLYYAQMAAITASELNNNPADLSTRYPLAVMSSLDDINGIDPEQIKLQASAICREMLGELIINEVNKRLNDN
jgi:hypothetical protein